jgi:hypothetical protein
MLDADKSAGIKPCIQGGQSSGQRCEASEACKKLKDTQHEYRDGAVVLDVAHEMDTETDSDIEVFCMICQASAKIKNEIEPFQQQASQKILDPVRRTTSIKPPAQRRPRKLSLPSTVVL